MKAIVQDRYGAPDVLELRDVDDPSPAPHEVLVRVHASAVNAYDWHLMRGDPYVARLVAPQVMGRKAPKRPVRGRDFAGRVEAVGAQVSGWTPGDEVYGDTGHASGAFAEYLTAPESHLDTKPAGLTFEQAAAVPLAGNTALLAVRDVGRVEPGQRILINGASGGVGTFAVQIAKALGGDVTAVCSTRNVDLVRSLGADHVVDYQRDDFARDPRRYDVVLDLAGSRSLTDLRRVLTPAGTLVLSGGGNSEGGSLFGPMGLAIRAKLTARFVSQRLVQLAEAPSAANLATLRELIDAGKVTPAIDRTYPLKDTPDAIRYVETEHARAKVIITM
jgi:NADPH:quinone reductase-like Zn-dependent oxidoreductase